MRRSGEGAYKSLMSENKSPNLVVGNRFSQIDGLRAVAVIMVTWAHAAEIASSISIKAAAADYYTDIARFGASGVTLFFVISGFLITGILIDTKDKQNRLKNFYIRRMLRIMPLYYLGMLFIFFVIQIHVLNGGQGYPWPVYAYHAAFINNWVQIFDNQNFLASFVDRAWMSHLWSLAVEQQFYLVWPICFYFLLGRNENAAKYAIILVMGLSFMVRVWLTSTDLWFLSHVWTPARADSLLAGAFLALIVSQRREVAEEVNQKAGVIVPILVGLLALYYITSSGKNTLHLTAPIFSITLTTWIYFFWLNASFLGQRKNIWGRILEIRFFQLTGEISYGIYIFSAPVQIIICNILIENSSQNYIFNHLTLLIAGFALSYMLALASYKFMEKPIMRWKNVLAPYGKTGS